MRSIASVLGLQVIVASISLQAAEDVVSYNRDIRPLLSDRCFACHGPDDAKREAKLRLDISDGDLSPYHARDGHHVIKSGDPDSSELWKRLTTDDPSLQMPPKDSGKKASDGCAERTGSTVDSARRSVRKVLVV